MICLYCGDYGCEECSSFDVESSRMYLELKTKLQASQDEVSRLSEVLTDIMQCVEHLGMNSSDGHTLNWVDELCTGIEERTNNQASEQKGEG